MRWQLKSALTGAMLIASVNMAQAETLIFNFSGSGTSTLSPFSLTVGAVTVDVSGHSVNDTRTTIYDENVTRHNLYGIGVSSYPGESFPVDSSGNDEFIQFVFSENVSITSAEFTYIDSHGYDDFKWLTDTNNNNILDAVDFSSLSARLDLGTSSPSIYSSFGPAAQDIRVLGIGAFTYHDAWKLKTLTVEYTTPVPVPAALPLFGTGLALMGFIGWRRRRKLAAAA